ncbi:hypothetical protein FQA39_LY00493 [Lamprigera yunnana]|nr:hypothetical protein FQA39_LY00493 [Lamprigera yunnana]
MPVFSANSKSSDYHNIIVQHHRKYLGNLQVFFDTDIGSDGHSEANVLQIWKESLKQCDGKMWKSTILHTENIIPQWWSSQKSISFRF